MHRICEDLFWGMCKQVILPSTTMVQVSQTTLMARHLTRVRVSLVTAVSCKRMRPTYLLSYVYLRHHSARHHVHDGVVDRATLEHSQVIDIWVPLSTTTRVTPACIYRTPAHHF
jgi:hypothetical protein